MEIHIYGFINKGKRQNMLFINNPLLEFNNYKKAIEYSLNICDAFSVELNEISYISVADNTIKKAKDFYERLDKELKESIIIKKARKKLYEDKLSIIDTREQQKYHIIKTYYRVNNNSKNILKLLNQANWNSYLKNFKIYCNGQVFMERLGWDLIRINTNNEKHITKFIEILGKENILNYYENYNQKIDNNEKNVVKTKKQNVNKNNDEKSNNFVKILLYDKNIKFNEFIDYAFERCDAISLTTNRLEIEGDEQKLRKVNSIENNTIKKLEESYICTKRTSKWKYRSAYKYVKNLETYNCTINFYKTTYYVRDYLKQYKMFFNFSMPYPEDLTFYKNGKVWSFLDSNKDCLMINIENEEELEIIERLLDTKINIETNNNDDYIKYM